MSAMSWLNGRRGQTLAVGIGVLAPALFWFGIVDPARSWFADRAEILDQREALLHRMREVAATLPALRAAVAVSARGDSHGTMTLPGASDALAAADLQERVQKMASAAGATLTAVETLPVTTSGRWHRVALRISLNAPWPVLMDLLRSFNQSPTQIFVNDVHFHSTSVVSRPTMLPIQASMALYGLRAGEAGAGT